MTIEKTDVLIIGGGPAGSTFGTVIRKGGWDVTLLEKDHHPRFHIGESLLPMNMPILERLGVMDEVRRIGVPKLGADFTIGNSNQGHQTFYFGEALGESPAQAFEVRRSQFDQILFENCKSSGVRTMEGMRVRQATFLENGSHRVTATDAVGNEHVWEARFLVDASGRDTFISSANGWKRRNRKHASAAVFGHFRGVPRRAGEDQGNISLYWFEHGWIWMIPLQDGVMSVGAVCVPSYLRTRRGTLNEFLLTTLNAISETRERMKGAEAVMAAQATGNYSYLSKRMHGPGFLMIGDAFAFIDPVFSSGVYLAMTSAEHATKVAEAWLSGKPWQYRLECRRFARYMNKGLAGFSWFIYRFTTPAMRNLMGNPRNVLQVMQAIISMLAGDVFSNRRVRRRLIVFKTIYLVSWLLRWRESFAARRLRMEGVQTDARRAVEP
jgi:flavin-dependent dehydrogenase